MNYPSGCKMGLDKGNIMCKLRKSLYELKQSPRVWFGKFSKSMKGFRCFFFFNIRKVKSLPLLYMLMIWYLQGMT